MHEKPKYRLQDLIDIEQFQGLQDRLNEIYSFPSAIIDNEGNILTATAWQDVCTKFHRLHPECEKDCIKSDQYILSHLDEAQPAVSYRCPRGLVDNATPIIIEGVHYGNFFTGQFFLEPPELEFYRTQARKYGFNEETYLEAVKKVPVWSQKQLKSYLFFIRGLIEVISSSGLKRLKEIEARKQIEETEERAGAILRQMLDGFWVTDRKNGRIVDVNDALCQMLGYAREELLGMAVADVEAIDSPEDIRRRIKRIVREGSAHFESKFRRKDGSVIDVEVSLTYLPTIDMIFSFHRDITKRKETEKERDALLAQATSALEEAARTKESLNSLFERVSDGFVAFDADFNYIYINERGGELLGRKPEDLIGKNYWTEYPEAVDTPFANAYVRAMETQQPIFFEDCYTPWNRWFLNRIYPSKEGITIFFVDVTEQKKAEKDLSRLNRELRAISNCNQLLVRAEDEQTLLNDICRIVCEEAGYRMAWVGFAENDEEKTVRPAAWAGFEDGYVTNARISWADNERGRGPTGLAIRTGKSISIQDFAADPSVALWRENALQRGYRSSIALPLKDENGRPFGALMIYSNEPNSFDSSEIRLMEELAGDLAFGVTVLRARTERKLAEEALHAAKTRLETTINVSPLAIISLDRENKVQLWNPAAEGIFGWRAEEVLGRPNPLVIPSKQDEYKDLSVQVLSGHPLMNHETVRQRKGGSTVDVSLSSAIIYDSAGNIDGRMAILMDITDRKRATAALAHSHDLMSYIIEHNRSAVAVHDKDMNYVYVSQRYLDDYNVKEKDVIGKNHYEVFPDLPQKWRDVHQRVLKGEVLSAEDDIFERADGSVEWTRWECRPWYEADGSIGGLIVYTEVITERKRVEEAIRRFNQQLASAVDTGRSLAASLNQQLIYQALHDGLQHMFPDVATIFISRFDAGRKMITAVHGSQDGELIDVAGLPEIPLPPPGQGTQSQVIHTKKPLRVNADLQQKQLNELKVMVGQYDGRLIQSALYVPMLTQEEVLGVVQLQSYHPNRFSEEDMRVLSLIANTAAVSIQNAQLYETAQLEIAERKQAEEALRTSEEQYRRLINVLPSGVVVHSQGRIVLVNRAGSRFMGASEPDQLIGAPFMDHIHPDFRDMVHKRVQQTQDNSQEAELIEAKLLRLDGSGFDAEQAAISVNYAGQPSTLAVFNDITERKQREREVHTIATLSAALRTAPNRAEMLPVIVEQTVNLLSCHSATIEIVEPQTGWVTVEAAYGEWASLKGSRQEPGTGINAIISQTLEPFYSHDMENDPSPFFNHWAKAGVRGCAGVPLIAQEKLIGFIWMGRKTDIAESDIELLSAIADIAANAIHRATLHEQTQQNAAELARAYDITLEGWARALELRDQETVGHTRRVVEQTLDLARAIGLDESSLENIRRGALLHDIGKMGIPDSVLLKPGTLNEREWEIMRRHPEYAYNLLKRIDYLCPALDIPYCHHEKWDGSGYPRGLKGEQIPLPARIFAIVDVWDALTSDRPYRPAWSQENALKYIQQEEGKHFDPAVVEAFLRTIKKDGSPVFDGKTDPKENQ